MSKRVKFSFDDGPAPAEALRSILDTLDREGIRAEFYMLGEEVQQNRALVVLTVERGHTVQNHSWSHENLATAPGSVVHRELAETQRIIAQTTGRPPTKIRPPYGAGGWPNDLDRELRDVARSMSLQITNWDVDTEDWKAPRGLRPKLSMIRRQLENTRAEEPDILMHVQHETATDLPELIRALRDWGYSIGSR